jgi:hypothetical protein
MPFELMIWSEVFNPDLTFRILSPSGWTVVNKLPETPGALFNNIWITSQPEFVSVNLSLIVYPKGHADQKTYFEKHLELYQSNKSIEILEFGALEGHAIPFDFIRLRSRESGMETIGTVALYATDKFCYILQFVAPTRIYDRTKQIEEKYIAGFEIRRREGIPLPVRPNAGTNDGLGGWVAPAMPFNLSGKPIPTLVYVNEQFGFSFIVPADSSFNMVESSARWAVIVNLPFTAEDRQAAFAVQVVDGTELTSALFLDQVERGLVEQRRGKRIKRVSLAGRYGGLEHLVMESEHQPDKVQKPEFRNMKVTGYVWVHTRVDRSFILELMAPESIGEDMAELANYLCNGFRVFEFPDANADDAD